MADSEQKKLQDFVDRRHPEYEESMAHWDFLESCYEGGRAWFEPNIFRYIKEGDQEFSDRLERAYRFNHSREVVDLVNKYIFKGVIARNEDDAPDFLKDFWKSATRNGLPVKQLMKRLSSKSSTYGRIWVVVDNNLTEQPASKADEKKAGAKVFAYTVRPQDALDYSWDDKGELNWILLRETHRDDADPMGSSGNVSVRYRLWTRTEWKLWEETKEGPNGEKRVIRYLDGREHNLGEVPVIKHDNVESDEAYAPPALIADIAYLDRAVTNYLSNLDAIIQDQTFSQLAMPAQGLIPGEEPYRKMLEMGTKRIFLYDGEAKQAPAYISPDPRQAQLVIAVINKIINEIYHTLGMAGERTKEDNSVGIDNSSGVAKAYDFDRMNTLLCSKAEALDNTENRIARLAARWHGEELKEDFVKYPDTFDVRGLYDEFEIATSLALLGAPRTVRREQMKAIIEKLFPRLKADLKKAMLAETDSWPPKEELMVTGAPGARPSLTPPKDSKQGQNTDGGRQSAGAQ